MDDNYAAVLRVSGEYAGLASDGAAAGQTALRLIVTAWHSGASAVQSLGEITWHDARVVITDADLYAVASTWTSRWRWTR